MAHRDLIWHLDCTCISLNNVWEMTWHLATLVVVIPMQGVCATQTTMQGSHLDLK